jgi:hypothetical protein
LHSPIEIQMVVWRFNIYIYLDGEMQIKYADSLRVYELEYTRTF